MAEIYFYHLEREPAETLLVTLLAKGLQRGLRMSVESPDAESLARLSERLWASEDVAFLPHGLAGEANATHQPILLAASNDNANGSSFASTSMGQSPWGLMPMQG
ncbi:MAG: DNA polymerase III subunit chi [Hyphomicrobiales bacterium]